MRGEDNPRCDTVGAVEPHDAGVPMEAELRGGLPRRPRWRLPRLRLWLRLACLGPPTLLLGWILLHSSWLFVLAALGAPVQARIVERRAQADRYTVTLAYPTGLGPGAVARRTLDVSPSRWGALVRTEALPARRLGAGRLGIVRVEEDGRPLEARSAGLWLVMAVVPSVLAAWVLMWGRLAREFWLVRWGRPVSGVVRSRDRHGFARFPRYAVSYEYRELTRRGASLALYGTARVARAVFDGSQAGQPLTVLHALWNPRWHVAYRFARFDAQPDRARPSS
jgi:hypothetical protein